MSQVFKEVMSFVGQEKAGSFLEGRRWQGQKQARVPVLPGAAKKLRFRMRQGLLMMSLAGLGVAMYCRLHGLAAFHTVAFSPHSLQLLPETSPLPALGTSEPKCGSHRHWKRTQGL